MASCSRRVRGSLRPTLGSERVRLLPCAWLALAALACTEDERLARAVEAESISTVELPGLGCFAAHASSGSCQRAGDCAPDARCVLDLSRAPVDRAPAPLVCGSASGSKGAGEPCELGSECESGLCALVGLCLEPCLDRGDCGAREICRPVEARTGPDALGPVLACARSLALPDDVQLTVSAGGTLLHEGANELAVPGAAAPGIVFVQAECAQSLELLRVRAGTNGPAVYDRAAVRSGERAENPVLHDGSPLAALIYPNNPLATLSSEGLAITVQVPAPGRADVVVASRAAGPHRLDVQVFYVGGGSGLVEGGFHPGEPRVLKLLEGLQRRMRQIGLSLGNVREYDVVGALREELAVLEVPTRMVGARLVEGRPARLGELFSLSAGSDTPAVNVFLVRDMGGFLGIAGGIPGPLGVHGSARSGVALAADVLGNIEDADLVLLHEIAHFFGLFHTTESTGSVLDPLLDTPECPPARDADENGELATWECTEHGADNLMFWSGDGAELSPQQVEVLARSVVLR